MKITLHRSIKNKLISRLDSGKVIILLGPRRVGKTRLLEDIATTISASHLWLNGEDIAVQEQLKRQSVDHYKNLLKGHELLIIDEAQKIPEIGQILKLMIDNIDGIQIIATGSSAFDLNNYTGEPLTGRKTTFQLYAISETEFDQIETAFQKKDQLHERLVYGNYPELLHIESSEEKNEYLNDLVNSYLLKDILAFDSVRNSDKILSLLRMLAFQCGSEVSLQELGKRLGMSKNTVEKYLDLLTKVFVIHKLEGFSRNLDKEITKSSKWYFYDNGIRNILVANMNPIELRNDVGILWENYVISERIKKQSYEGRIVQNYFWRTYDQQEIDWIENSNGKLQATEFTWNSNKTKKIPVAWKNAYKDSEFKVINSDNYLDWVRYEI